MVSRQIGHIRSSEGSSEASCAVAWGSWLLLAAGEEVPSPAKSSCDAISHCKQKRHTAHGLPRRRSLREAAKLLLGAVLVLPPAPGTVPGQTSDSGTSVRVPAPRAGW